MAFNHNSITEDSEPQWSEVDKNKLPNIAFADMDNRRFPHHWVKNGKVNPDTGRYVEGEMFLHRGGLQAALAASQGARSGEETSNIIKSHLQEHQKIVFGEEKSIIKTTNENAVNNLFVKDLGGEKFVTKHKYWEKVVYGIIYAPNKIDSQGDYMTASEIQKMQSRFMRLYSSGQSFIDNFHDFIPGAGQLEESWIVREGDALFPDKKYVGSWAVGVRVLDDFLWKQIQQSKINAFSLAGMVDLNNTITLEVTAEQAKTDYFQIAYYDDEKKTWLVNGDELVNARLVAFSFVERGANLEPRFPHIKSENGWVHSRLNKAKSMFSNNNQKDYEILTKAFDDIYKQNKKGFWK